MQPRDTETTTTTWSWSPEWSDDLRRKTTITVAVAAAVMIGSVVVAALSPARTTIVVTVMIVGIGVFWWLEHRRFRSTVVSLATDGVLHVADGRTSQTIDLSCVDSVTVRKRTQSGRSLTSATPKWTIELAGPGETLVHPIAHAAGLFNPETADVERLEANLVAHVERLGGQTLDGARSNLATPMTAAADRAASDAPPTVVASSERYEWRPPRHPNADRRRRWFRVGYIGAALAVAVLGVVTAWGDWVGVILSAVTVPGILLAVGGGLDWGLGLAPRFRLVVDDGVLHVERTGAPKEIALRGATVAVDRSSSHVATGSGSARTTHWVLTVQGADGATLTQTMPSFGTVTVESDYVALERELRRRT